MDIVNKEISKEAKVDVEFKDAKLNITFSYEGAGAGVSVVGSVSADYLLDKLAAAIPGQVDDAIIAVMKMAISKV